jgi:hypothetical protein
MTLAIMALVLLLFCSSAVSGQDYFPMWSQTYYGLGNNVAYVAIEAPDGGYLAVGSIDSLGEDNSDFFVIKTDKNGNAPDLPPIICVVSPQNTTYDTKSILLNFTITKDSSWMGYSLDGQNNITFTGPSITLMLCPTAHIT